MFTRQSQFSQVVYSMVNCLNFYISLGYFWYHVASIDQLVLRIVPTIFHWAPENSAQWNLNHNTTGFKKETEFENAVCNKAVIWSRAQYVNKKLTWWRHQMETFSPLLAICAGNSTVPGEFPAQRPVTRSFHVFFDLRQNKPLSKQSSGWWFETLSHPLWRHCNDVGIPLLRD